MNNVVLGHKGAVSVISMLILSKLFLYESVIIGSYGAVKSCLIPLFSATINFSVFVLVNRLLSKNHLFDTKNSFTSKLVMRILALLFTLVCIITLCALSETIKLYSLLITPIDLIIAVIALCVLYITCGSFKNVIRISSLFFGMLIFFILLVVVLCFRLYDFNDLFPIFDTKTNFTDLLKHTGLFSDIFILLLIPKNDSDTKRITKYAFSATVISSSMFILATLASSLVFSKTTADCTSAFYMLTGAMYNAALVQNLSAIYFFVVSIPAVISCALYLVLAVELLSASSQINDTKPIIYSLYFIVVSVSYFIIKRFEIGEYYKLDYIVPIAFLLSVAGLALSKRGKKE